MLIEFTVGNYRSINDKQTFSLLTDSIDEHPENVIPSPNTEKYDLLKIGLIYGANASGKSNLLLALSSFIDLILGSDSNKPKTPIQQYQPYKLSKKTLQQPVYFEMEFIHHDNIRYHYLVQFSSTKIEEEILSFFPNKQRVILFKRTQGKPIHYSDALKGPKKQIEKILNPNTLFLSKGASNNNE